MSCRQFISVVALECYQGHDSEQCSTVSGILPVRFLSTLGSRKTAYCTHIRVRVRVRVRVRLSLGFELE